MSLLRLSNIRHRVHRAWVRGCRDRLTSSCQEVTLQRSDRKRHLGLKEGAVNDGYRVGGCRPLMGRIGKRSGANVDIEVSKVFFIIILLCTMG